MRININFPDELIAVVDQKAKALNLNRTAYIVTSMTKYLQQEDAFESINKMLKLMDVGEDKPAE